MNNIMTESFYDILGVDENTSAQEVKKAYRQLSMKWHPDKNSSPEAKGQFQKISEAYETLGDDKKRQEYNMVRKNPFLRGNSSTNVHHADINMDALFSSLFGMAQGIHTPNVHGFNNTNAQGFPPGFPQGFPQGFPPGFQNLNVQGMHNQNVQGFPNGNIHVFHGPNAMNFQQSLQKPTPIIKTIEITLENVLLESTVPLEIERWTIDNGNKVFEKETIYVNIPGGVDDNELIILRNKGNALNDRCIGDIKLFVKIINNSLFKRVGLDIIIDKNITLKDALCGFSFEIKHLNGKSYTLHNNAGNIIPAEYKKIVPNMGLTRDSHIGNMVIIFHVEFPEKLSVEQIEGLKNIL